MIYDCIVLHMIGISNWQKVTEKIIILAIPEMVTTTSPSSINGLWNDESIPKLSIEPSILRMYDMDHTLADPAIAPVVSSALFDLLLTFL